MPATRKSTRTKTSKKTRTQTPPHTQQPESNSIVYMREWALHHPKQFVKALLQSGVTKRFKRFRAKLTPKSRVHTKTKPHT